MTSMQSPRAIGHADAPRRVRVVLTDDHAVVRTGYRRLLELEDDIDVVAEFVDGEATLRWFESNHADILVLDLTMPGQGGLITLKRLQARMSLVRVLVFTMHDNPDMLRQSLDFGARGYITKSSPPESLVSAIRRISRGQQALSADMAQTASRSGVARLKPHAQLSRSELEAFLLFAQGLAVSDVAERCGVSLKTASNYQTIVRRKTRLGSTLEMYRYAREQGLLADVKH